MVIARQSLPLYIQLTKYRFQWSNETLQVKVMEVDTTLLSHLESSKLELLSLPSQSHIFSKLHHYYKEGLMFSNLDGQFYASEGTLFL